MTTHPMRIGKLARKRNFKFKGPNQIIGILSELRYPNYRVKPIAGTYTLRIMSIEMREWCDAQLGEQNWVYVDDTIWFTNESYFAMFLLRWQ